MLLFYSTAQDKRLMIFERVAQTIAKLGGHPSSARLWRSAQGGPLFNFCHRIINYFVMYCGVTPQTSQVWLWQTHVINPHVDQKS
jgi:hypothetical protein